MDKQVPMVDENGQLVILTMFSVLMIPFYERIHLPALLGEFLKSSLNGKIEE